MPNIEIKAHYPNAEQGRAACIRLGGRLEGIERQTDTYFRTSDGRLKLRESSLKGGQLIPYLRPNATGPKKSDYAVVPVADPASFKTLLAQILGIEQVVVKTREVYLIGNVRVHLDDVEGLGKFLEFEAVYLDPSEESIENSKVNDLILEFGIQPEQLLKGSYRELTQNHA